MAWSGMETPLEQHLLLLLLLLPFLLLLLLLLSVAWLSWRNYEMRELLRGVN